MGEHKYIGLERPTGNRQSHLPPKGGGDPFITELTVSQSVNVGICCSFPAGRMSGGS